MHSIVYVQSDQHPSALPRSFQDKAPDHFFQGTMELGLANQGLSTTGQVTSGFQSCYQQKFTLHLVANWQPK